MAVDKVDWVGGLDLGQSRDFTALVLIERTTQQDRKSYEPAEPRRFAVRHLERFDLGVPYPSVVQRVKDMYDREPLRGTGLAIDQTGVGRAVVDMFVAAKPRCVIRPITITAGSQTTAEGPGWHVPKKELVGALQVLLQSRRLQVAKGLQHAGILVRELENFKVKITASANESFEAWRERDHDDLVLATAMAVWLGERGSKEFWLR